MFDESVLAQMVGVGILEFGVILHRYGKISSYAQQRCSDVLIPSVLIGLTLAVTSDFVTLFVVIIFHREFFLFTGITF